MIKKIIIIIISIIVLFFISITYIVSNNKKYENTMLNDIKENYSLKDDIKYLNKSNFYYIIKTNTSLILLDDKYSLIKEISLEDLFDLKEDYDIVYKLNKLMYEVKEIKETSITYKYYDIYTGELLLEN